MRKFFRVLFLLSPVIFLLVGCIFYRYLFFWDALLPKCSFHALTGLYCPGCGCTRSAFALLHADLFTSLRSNPLVPFAALLAALAYAEYLLFCLHRPCKLVPCKTAFWVCVGVLFFAFYVARNLFPALAPPDFTVPPIL